jgi:hypothetical protein
MMGQNVGIGTTSPDASAKLEVQSTTGGVLIPRLTTQERNDIPAPIANGLLIYNSENTRFEFWDGTAWGPIASASSGGSSLEDIDGDTKVNVEMSADEDTIRMSVKNHEILKIDQKTFHVTAENKGTLIGLNAGKNLPTSDSWNTILGYRAGEESNSGITNTMIGAYAGSKGNKGSSNTFLGGLSGQESTGDNNTYLGIQAGQRTGNSSDNTYLGVNAGAQNTGSQNISIGHFSSYFGTGSNNIGIGRFSLYSPGNSVSGLVAIGDSTLYRSGQSSTFPFQGINNTAVGSKALKKNNQGLNNTAVGNNSLEHNTSGTNNTSLGSSAGNSNTDGFGNTSIGSLSLVSNKSGAYNVSVGYEAGRFSGGNRNTFLGYASGASNLIGSGNTFIGHRAGELETGDDKLYIHNSASPTPLIYGDFADRTVNINETLLIENFKTNDSTLNITSLGNNTISLYAENIDQSSIRPTAEFVSNSGLAPAVRGINGEDGAFANAGGYFQSRGQYGYGVYGVSTKGIDGFGAGGEFVSFGAAGKGVVGKSTFSSDTTNYGGYFLAAGRYGVGAHAQASNNEGIGLVAKGGKLAAHLDGDTKISGNTGIGKSPGSAGLEIDMPTGETPMTVYKAGIPKFQLHANGGLSIGSDELPPNDGLAILNLSNTGDHPLRVNDAGIIYQDVQNKYKSYSPPSFVDNPLTGLVTNNSPAFKLIPWDTFAWADWGLPHNSVAKRFSIYFTQAAINESIRVEIFKKPIAGNPIELASFILFGTGVNNTASGSIVLNETIDNQNYSYYFRIWNQNLTGAVWIYGVTQGYKE